MNKSRLVIALGLVLALGVSGVALGTGATDNEAFVDGKLKTTKLPKKNYVKNQLFLGVRTETNAPLGTQSNPAVENISFGCRLGPRMGPWPYPAVRRNAQDFLSGLVG